MVDVGTDISTLNGLIATTIDSADGYEQAATEADDADLAALFRRFGSERRRVVGDLRAQVVALGGEPEDDGTLFAGAHRAFLKLKSAFGNSRKAVIDEVEAGEDVIKARYENAMKADLGAQTRAAIDKAYVSVREGHDTFSAMKHSYAG
ncbi:hypothetical protein GCM10011529_04750 [Polymorphobacter glacialis]|uniref:DUF2383 domain-containing protein n=1 Tax=Sandarakinorhabdus glacialis TaxID=1614636 RepID=A0A916ZKU2_9SPHN|nr:PA2169 family four-helix-bundle protein [Polymorphobacter glacialis]GGE01466.1 hypothetical protein GCM10011529_04750 [Polymorphobacter glacialis]